MSLEIKLEQFEGPYELLLDLIKQEEMDVTQLALAKVTEQYLDYLDEVEQDRASELSDFLVVASKLLLLKSSKLLPEEENEQDQDRAQLEQQLKIYKKYKEASKNLEEIWCDRQSYVRKNNEDEEIEFTPPENLDRDVLQTKFKDKIEEHETTEPPIETKVDNAISLKEKIDHIRSHLSSRSDNFSFDQTVTSRENKTEIIVSFLAILELAKQDEVRLKQSRVFGSINIANY